MRSRRRPLPSRLLPLAAAVVLLGPLAGESRAQLTGFGSDQIDDGTGETSEAEPNDRFGSRLVAGFFDDDPYEDLAVGVPDEDIGALSNTGAVHVFYGSPGGPKATGDQGFTVANTIGVVHAKADTRFGHALAAGDLDGDGLDDLVIGVPGLDTAGQNSAGGVVVLRGTPDGLRYQSSFCGFLHQNRTNDSSNAGGADNGVAAGESFGEAVAILPATPTGVPWIAIGVPGENMDGVDDSGIVELVLTRASGAAGCLETTGAVTTFVLHQAGPLCAACGEHYEGQLEVDDFFGSRLAVGDFDDDGVRDLAVGVPHEDVGTLWTDCGVVQVFYAAANGFFPTAGDEVWSQDTSGVQESCGGHERFGDALAAGNLDATAGDDLAIGAPEETLGESPDRFVRAGVVHVLYSAGSGGLSADGDQLLDESSPESNEYYGSTLLAANLAGSSADDLLVGVPNLRSTFDDWAGVVRLLIGSSAGGFAGVSSYSQDTSGVPDSTESSDLFGDALAVGDFDGNAIDDLAIGVPGEGLVSTTEREGAVTILYSLIPSKNAFGTVQYSSHGIVVGEGSGTHAVVIRRTGGAPVGVKVSYDNAGGSATEGVDHSTIGGSKTWAEGEIGDKTFNVTITNDTRDEDDELILIPLSSPTAGLALGFPDTFGITIQDDDEGGVLRFLGSSVSVAESIGSISFTVARVDGAASGVGVHVASSAGTATSGVDFTPVSADLTYAAGDGGETVTLEILDDELDESNETLSLTLSAPTGGAVLGTPKILPVTIVDDEGPGFLRFASSSAQAGESVGTANVVVERFAGEIGTVTVDYATIAGGTATPGDDYVVGSGTLEFADGETSKSVPVAIVDDDTDEGNETVRLELSNPTGGAGLAYPESLFLTILDDEGGPTPIFADDFEEGGGCVWSDSEGLEPACLP